MRSPEARALRTDRCILRFPSSFVRWRHRLRVAETVEDARRVILQHRERSGEDQRFDRPGCRRLRADFNDCVGTSRHAERAMWWHRDEEEVPLIARLERHHESLDANLLLVEREYGLAELRNDPRSLSHRFDVGERLPRHDAVAFGQERRAVHRRRRKPDLRNVRVERSGGGRRAEKAGGDHKEETESHRILLSVGVLHYTVSTLSDSLARLCELGHAEIMPKTTPEATGASFLRLAGEAIPMVVPPVQP